MRKLLRLLGFGFVAVTADVLGELGEWPGPVRPRQCWIAAEIGRCDRTVRRHVAVLVALGVLRVWYARVVRDPVTGEIIGRGPNTYWVDGVRAQRLAKAGAQIVNRHLLSRAALMAAVVAAVDHSQSSPAVADIAADVAQAAIPNRAGHRGPADKHRMEVPRIDGHRL